MNHLSPGAKFVDYFWVPEMDSIGPVVHHSLRCYNIKDKSTAYRISVSEDDGVLYATAHGRTQTVGLCERCPKKLSTEWIDQAACLDTGADFFTTDKDEQERLISTYCAVCPVVGDCLEWAANDSGTTVGIWGGMVVPVDRSRRSRRYAVRRKELRK